jgi:putative tryptophan/tyrosine transport system substrate-binding protein
MSFNRLRRRQFITLIGGAAAAWPLAARAQQPALPVVGMLQIGASWDFTGFRQGLKELGYVEGQNLAIEYRWANGDPNRLPELAADLVHRQVRVIASIASPRAVQEAKAATNTIPIVFGYGSDPVQWGHVASLDRPGGNITGMTSVSGELVGKQLGILHELLPQVSHFGALENPNNGNPESFVKDAQAAASAAFGQTVEVLNASTSREIDAVFTRFSDDKRAQALLVSNDPLFLARRVQLAILSARYAIPAIYPFREQVEAGGLLSYGPDLIDRDRQVGRYVGRILKGEKPADLPVMQPTKFGLVINVNTAEALGLDVPPTLLALADEVIE